MTLLTEVFEERLQEIDAYLDLLDALERQAQAGPPIIGGSAITPQQQKILYSSVFLQLYNLVEATVTWCLEAVCAAAAEQGRWRPADLSQEVRREWVRALARTHVELNADNRLQATMEFCDYLIQAVPIQPWRVDRRGGGSWDDIAISEMAKRIGCTVRLSPGVLAGIKRKVKDDKCTLTLIKDLRNRLAHGSLSFTECGDGLTVVDLRQLKDWTANYLREIVAAFLAYIQEFVYLDPASRPVAGAT